MSIDVYAVNKYTVDELTVDFKAVFRQYLKMKILKKVPDARTLMAMNVQKIRMQMGLSQERLAEMAGFHRTYVSQVERSVANATTDNIQKLADVLSVPVARLFEVQKGDSPES